MSVAESAPRDDAPHGLSGLLATVSFWIGALGLLSAMAADALAVAGRHLGLPVVGSIEIVQASVVIGASAAMVGATLAGAHASVHILLEQMSARGRRILQAIADLFGALLFGLLAAGSIWVAAELWRAQEVSDVLLLPIQPLRLFWCANAVLVAALFVLRVFARSPQGETHDEL